jgi:signal transduction histidine kinase
MERAQHIDIYLLLFSGTLILFVMAAFVVLFIYIYRKRLSRQQASIRDMQYKLQQDILHSNMETLETERKRFAADLHDEIGGKLSALRLNLVQLQRTGYEASHTEELVAGSKEIIDTVITTVRRISHNLMPPTLEMFGIANAVEELCGWVNTSSALSVQLYCELDGILLDQKKQLALYRIIQELFSNTIRHAKAQTITLRLVPFDKELQLVYKDDGTGLPASIQHRSRGMGFKNIESRVHVLKGTVSYPAHGKGFECIIVFPVN